MSHEYQRPNPHEVPQHQELLIPDDNAADTRLVAGTRKLMFVMFKLLGLPPMPSQLELDLYIEQIAKDSEG